MWEGHGALILRVLMGLLLVGVARHGLPIGVRQREGGYSEGRGSERRGRGK